jgi:hypothetical protein
MTIKDISLRVIDGLNAAGIPHALVGSFSSSYYGVPRSTLDADFVVEFGGGSLEELLRRLGPDFAAEPQVTFETMTGTVKYQLHFRGSPFRVELFSLSSDPHDQERWRRRKPVLFCGRQTFLPTPEDVVVMKLRWARSRDLEDVRGVIGVQGDALDWPYIENWCDRHGTRPALEQIRLALPRL